LGRLREREINSPQQPQSHLHIQVATRDGSYSTKSKVWIPTTQKIGVSGFKLLTWYCKNISPMPFVSIIGGPSRPGAKTRWTRHYPRNTCNFLFKSGVPGCPRTLFSSRLEFLQGVGVTQKRRDRRRLIVVSTTNSTRYRMGMVGAGSLTSPHIRL